MTEAAVRDIATDTDNRAAEVLLAGRGLDLSLGGRTILSHVDLTVSEREIVTLIGPNGAGKTMLLRLLLGLKAPDAGEVVRRPGLTVGYLPQKFTVDATLPLTVLRMLSLTSKAEKDVAKAHLEEVGAGHLGRALVHELSGGELQRVMLARALMRDPDLLVLDEPMQGVDFTGELDLYELIGRLRDRRGCGILLVSHDLHLVMASTDSVVCLNNHVCCAGRPETVSRDPKYLELFGSRAAESLAVYAHAHDHDHDLSGDVVDHGHGHH